MFTQFTYSLLLFLLFISLHLWQIGRNPRSQAETASVATAGAKCWEYLVPNRSLPPSVLKSYSATLDTQIPAATSPDDSDIICLNQGVLISRYFQAVSVCFFRCTCGLRISTAPRTMPHAGQHNWERGTEKNDETRTLEEPLTLGVRRAPRPMYSDRKVLRTS